MEKNPFKFNLHDKLQNGDSETTTYGCRCNNPDICSNCYTQTCGLSNEKHICTTPSRAWKKVYLQKIEEEKKLKK